MICQIEVTLIYPAIAMFTLPKIIHQSQAVESPCAHAQIISNRLFRFLLEIDLRLSDEYMLCRVG